MLEKVMKVTLLKSGDQSEPQTVATGPRPDTEDSCDMFPRAGWWPGARGRDPLAAGELSLGGGSSEPAVAGAVDTRRGKLGSNLSEGSSGEHRYEPYAMIRQQVSAAAWLSILNIHKMLFNCKYNQH